MLKSIVSNFLLEKDGSKEKEAEEENIQTIEIGDNKIVLITGDDGLKSLTINDKSAKVYPVLGLIAQLEADQITDEIKDFISDITGNSITGDIVKWLKGNRHVKQAKQDGVNIGSA